VVNPLLPNLVIPVDDGIHLRPLRLEDAEPIYLTVEAQRERLEEWLPWPSAIHSAASEASFIRTSLGWMATGDGIACAIIADGHIAGGIGLNLIDHENENTHLGYWLAEEFVGRGIMTRATSALTTFAFDDLRLHRVVIRAATGNTRSRAIPMRLGFTHEGTEREVQLLNGRFVDLEVYSMLSTEWGAADS